MAGVRKRADQQAKKLAKALGGRVQPGSGSGWYAKGDVKAERFLVDCKFTDKTQYILKLNEIDKLRREALFEGKDWAFQITIQNRQLVVFDAQVLHELDQPQEA